MAYKPTAADLPPLQPQQAQGGFTPTLADLTPEQYSALHNIGAGMVNPQINAANLVGQGIDKEQARSVQDLSPTSLLAQDIKGQSTQAAPQIPHSGTGEYLLGNIAGLAAPFSGAERLAVGAGDVAKSAMPALEKIPNLVQRMGRTGAAGAATAYGTTAGDPTERQHSAEMGAALGTLGTLGAGVLKIPASYLKRVSHQIASRTVAPLHRMINESLASRFGATTPEATLQKAYQTAKGNATWKNLEPLVAEADNSQSEFTPTTYTNRANDLLKEAQADEKADPDSFKGLVAQIQGKIDRAPTSFQEALTQKKAINRMPSSWSAVIGDPKIQRSRYYAGQLGQALDQSVEDNATTPEAENFLNEWRNQRANHGALQQFYANPQSAVAAKDFDPAIKQDLENGNYKAVIQRYVPNKNQDMAKIAQFRGLIGNPQHADDAILQQAFQPYRNETGDIDALKLGKALQQGKVSDSILKLLSPADQTGLGNITHANAIASQIKKSPGVLHHIATHMLLSGGLGGLLASHVGVPWEAGFAGGLAAPKMLENQLGKLYEKGAIKLVKSGRIDKIRELADALKDDAPPKSWTDPLTPVRPFLYGAGLAPITQNN